MRTRNPTAVEAPVQTRDRLRWIPLVGQVLLILVAILLWQKSLQGVNLRQMTDLGLLTVLPVTFYLALVLLTISFCLANWEMQAYEPLLLLNVAVLILLIHGTPNILYGTLRYSWAWKHIGIIDYIQRNGSVDPTIENLSVYHNWPGFFAFNALATQVAGFQSALSYAGWGPAFFNLLDIGALLLIFRALTRDRRLIWMSIWFFYLANWVGQDYFSPQAMNYFLYLVVLGICLTWLSLNHPPSRWMVRRWIPSDRAANAVYDLFWRARPGEAREIGSLQRTGLMAVLILIFVVIASSHQLTPLMMISALTALVVFQVCRARSLPVVMAVITVTWVIYMAEAYFNGNVASIVKSIGSLSENINANFINLSVASSGQVLVSIMDRGLSALVGVLAILGFWRRVSLGKWDVPAVLLVLSPIPALLANGYGGEIVFRVYFFALPFMAFFAAALLFPDLAKGKSIRTAGMSIAIGITLLVGFLFGYYGKEQMYYFTQNEVQAAEVLNTIAPHGALISDITPNWPLQFKNYEFYHYLSINDLSRNERLKVLADPVDRIAQELAGYKTTAYFVITRSQKTEIDSTGLMPAGSVDRIESLLKQSSRFKVVYSNPDAVIFQLVR